MVKFLWLTAIQYLLTTGNSSALKMRTVKIEMMAARKKNTKWSLKI